MSIPLRWFPALLAGAGLTLLSSGAVASDAPKLIFSCASDNDLYRLLVEFGAQYPHYDSPAAAVAAAPSGAGVLILADGYPERPTVVEPAVFDAAARKELKVYVEYPAQLPGLTVGHPTEIRADDPGLWRPLGNERGVVTSPIFGQRLPPMRIVVINGCRHVPVQVDNAHLVLAKVAGVDTAVFGLKDTPTVPLLFDHPQNHNLLVATTGLSRFVTGRFMPADAWRTVWQTIFGRLQPGVSPVALRWTPTVRPTYGPDELLPPDAESRAVRRSADWVVRAHLLRHPAWPQEALDRVLRYGTVCDAPSADRPQGNGSLGVLEGFSSLIHSDGGQPVRYAVRFDCNAETAMLMASDAALDGRPEHAEIAANLLDYIVARSGLTGGPRADPDSPSYGLFGWSLDSPDRYWGDDNARVMLALGATAAFLKDSRWSEKIARCMLANLRTTGTDGFRGGSLVEALLKAKGWQTFWAGEPVDDVPECARPVCSPHYQAWLWACYLWAYEQTRFEPLLVRAEAGMRKMMEAYPAKWDWCLRSGTIERSRMLLPLAWLVRIEDTPEHRGWLRKIAEDLVSLQDASGAIREVIGDGGPGTRSNAEYGTRETSLIQSDGDPVCDLLYSCNFALVGLHEAAAATADPFYAQAEDKLARFLCRIQVRSETHPEFDGAWYRAFNFRNWEYWASNADWEWGPWCIETGWTQPWIAGTLALRQRGISLWDLVQKVDLRTDFARLHPQMLPDERAVPVQDEPEADIFRR